MIKGEDILDFSKTLMTLNRTIGELRRANDDLTQKALRHEDKIQGLEKQIIELKAALDVKMMEAKLAAVKEASMVASNIASNRNPQVLDETARLRVANEAIDITSNEIPQIPDAGIPRKAKQE